ncbi:cold-shock protein [Halobacillus litoralis]|uniref:Cold-shock protein n=3 Tax=Halobacillus TaxID=45667 RepID=A0A3E0JA32_9BACI|nr:MULTISPECIES: cold-shock protein [Halobacillus]MBN9652990.1 cold-shock protein [Halobacillus sp. GSS1]MEC3885939.1 cold-shock protein [Halobacillus sp. HZG1]MYL71118.1 cold-shock protein [Halobacillus litoralis]RDY68457.1 cold-shock protein [Halobacillus trueperi]REJ09649.1 cold-shock protein [Halobacillus trueperi]
MAFGKKNQAEIKEEDTKIWVCTSEDCNCWMRDNFRTNNNKKCPMCGSDMEEENKVLQVVENNSLYYKAES